ncbi:MAG: hypothetical protein GY920_20405 [Aliivibrio sp.]|nr:hypothetical protein [Aliivibrio sp.]MCP4322172.1 hypothetical protein [Alteromonadales bacterium]
MTLKQSEKQGTILVEKPVSPQPITSIQQIVEDASSWPVVDGVKQKDGFAYCDGSTLVNTSGTYDDFNTANGGLVLPNGPFRTREVDLTFSSTPSGWTLFFAKAVAYSDSLGNWRLSFNIVANTSSGNGSKTVSIDGVDFRGSGANADQALAILGSDASGPNLAWAQDGTSVVRIDTDGATSFFKVSGDVSLDGKPTWADANLESYPVISLQSNIANAIGIPEATTTQAGTVSTGGQTFAGDKTFEGKVTVEAMLATPRVDVVISSGGINAVSSYMRIDTEGSAATDDLTTINNGNDGEIIILAATSASRNIVIKHNVGNIITGNSSDFTLTNGSIRIGFMYASNDSNWVEIFRSVP